uniref:phospholipase A2 n=1 Tax=Lygus hesperus TaxID=30085 RepID=A0A0A9Z5E4_LYGHE
MTSLYAVTPLFLLGISNICAPKSSVKPRETTFGSTFPGTVWCGPGNTAKNDSHLGPLRDVDACCRAHDKCNDVIPRFSKKYGIFNPTMSPKYNCVCDRAFHKCLMNVPKWEGRAAEFIGSLYFETKIFPNCFTNDYPKRCVDKSKNIPWRCTKYVNASKKKKNWQWKDFGGWYIDFSAR